MNITEKSLASMLTPYFLVNKIMTKMNMDNKFFLLFFFFFLNSSSSFVPPFFLLQIIPINALQHVFYHLVSRLLATLLSVPDAHTKHM